jgi:Leucine-rich repeat (LRR) protein
MTTNVERYLNSLSEDILTLDISYMDIKYFPDLTRFKNLQELYCYDNELTSLPTLPQNLEKIYCENNQLTSLPTLPENLKELNCSMNYLTSIPSLPQNLKELYCHNNRLTSLPTLPQNLKELDCDYNQLNLLPTLPQNLKKLNCSHNQLNLLPTLPQNLTILYCSINPIYEIVNSNSLFQIKQNIQLLNNFRHLYYCLQYKKQFKKWLWEKVREPKIKKIFHPIYLIENLGDEDDLDEVLKNWK